MNIQDLQLTEQDFDLIISGLNELPNKGFAGLMMGAMLKGIITKDDPEAKAKYELEQKAEQLKVEREKKALDEDISVLKGKLIMLKRFLVTNDALKTVDDIINPHI
jgi:hypothetical protein